VSRECNVVLRPEVPSGPIIHTGSLRLSRLFGVWVYPKPFQVVWLK
jgi:hypothetical protein